MRAACLSLSAPSPARRPVRLALSALSPPSLSSATHLFTARRLALNEFAASTCLIPSRTAFTTCRRSMCCAAGLSFLASSRLFMQTLTYHALFGARISKYARLPTQACEGQHFEISAPMDSRFGGRDRHGGCSN